MIKKNQTAARVRTVRILGETGLLAVAVILLTSLGLWGQSAADTTRPVASAPVSQPRQTIDGSSATKPHDDTFVIGNDDVLAINVWKEPDISRSIPVRSDGKISLPLAGEILAAGRTPLKLERDIASKLQNYISEPEVTVMVQQINSEKFNVLG